MIKVLLVEKVSLVLTFSHEIIRTGKGALGGREGERRVGSRWRPAPVFKKEI